LIQRLSEYRSGATHPRPIRSWERVHDASDIGAPLIRDERGLARLPGIERMTALPQLLTRPPVGGCSYILFEPSPQVVPVRRDRSAKGVRVLRMVKLIEVTSRQIWQNELLA